MNAEAASAVAALNQRFLLDYPHEAARQLEAMPPEDVAELLAAPAPHAAARAWQALAPDVAAAVLELVPETLAPVLLAEAEPAMAVAVRTQLEPKLRAHLLKLLDAQVARELRALLKYPEDSAGRIMDPQVSPVREDHTVAEALTRLRALMEKYEFIGDVRGRGLMIGMDLVRDLKTRAPLARKVTETIFLESLKRGLVLMGYFPRVRINPPLVITEAQAEAGNAIMDEVFSHVRQSVDWRAA